MSKMHTIVRLISRNINAVYTHHPYVGRLQHLELSTTLSTNDNREDVKKEELSIRNEDPDSFGTFYDASDQSKIEFRVPSSPSLTKNVESKFETLRSEQFNVDRGSESKQLSESGSEKKKSSRSKKKQSSSALRSNRNDETGQSRYDHNKVDVEDYFGPKSYSNIPSYQGDKAEQKQLKHDELRGTAKHDANYWYDQLWQLCKDLKLREAVLLLEKKLPAIGVTPSSGCYRLVISCCARHGHTGKAFDLYRRMKSQGVTVPLKAYTCLFDACSKCHDKEEGLRLTKYLHEEITTRAVPLNGVHYHAMAKAYGRNGDLAMAFSVLDERASVKSLHVSTETINFLLQACVSDKQSGFRHGLMVWWRLRALRKRPDIFTYNLLIRCALECGPGNPELFGVLLDELSVDPRTVRKMKEAPLPRLPAGEPLLSNARNEEPLEVDVKKGNESDQAQDLDASGEVTVLDKLPDAILQPKRKVAMDLLAPIPYRGAAHAITDLSKPHHRLQMLGGVAGILRNMKRDGVPPQPRTFTQLLRTLRSTKGNETALLEVMDRLQIEPDIAFMNNLIKKRADRGQFEDAKDVVSLISERKMTADLVTYGCLAKCCRTIGDADLLLKEMEAAMIRPNLVILRTFIGIGTMKAHFQYILWALKKMRGLGLNPDEGLVRVLEDARGKALKNLHNIPAPGKTLSAQELRILDSSRIFILEYKRYLQGSTLDRKEPEWAYFREEEGDQASSAH